LDTTGETALAIENYERSLELNPDNENATEKLTELDKQASPSVQDETP